MENFGLIAGNGRLPLLVSEAIKESGKRLVIAMHRGETASDLKDHGISLLVRVGQIGKIINFFKVHQVKECVLAGGISRVNLFKGNVWPDLVGLKIIRRAGSIRDDLILREIANEIENNGIKVLSPASILPKCVFPAGYLTKHTLNPDQLHDALVGWRAAQALGEADVGQTVVVSGGVVVALEAVEGTDACVRRGLELARGPVTIVKISKPNQDLRLDLPTIGKETLTKLPQGVSAIVFEAAKTLIVEPDQVIELAESLGIVLVAFSSVDELVNLNSKINVDKILVKRY